MKLLAKKEQITNGIISTHCALKDDDDIQLGEREFYAHYNAAIIDTVRSCIYTIVDEEYKKFFIAPLLYEASVHTNTYLSI